MDNFDKACIKILSMIESGEVTTPKELARAKKTAAIEFKLDGIPKNSDIIAHATDPASIKMLMMKPMRTASGVAVIAAMTSPAPCPHGICIPCPGGPNSAFGTPQSYMGKEPATRRAIYNEFDPYNQVSNRLGQLVSIGHHVGKAELIIMGGTFTARDLCYQQWFVRRCLEAMNDFQSRKEKIGSGIEGKEDRVDDENAKYWEKEWVKTAKSTTSAASDSTPSTDPIKHKSASDFLLETAIKTNETSAVRNTGMTIETRPDYAGIAEIDRILEMGATKVELGVQSVYDFILTRMQRGHTVADTIEANRVLRDSGFKVGFHMMPGLPGSSLERDIETFRRLFTDESFMPDYLKIYPTLVTEGTKLHSMWMRGEYKALGNEDAVKLMAQLKSLLPKWVRLSRIQRDIPADQVIAGVTKSNLRQLAKERLRENGMKCKCIRCREVGLRKLEDIVPEDIEYMIEKYDSCGGVEHFISVEDTAADTLIGFLRLRFPANPHRSELKDATIVRELHVYGSLVPVGTTAKTGQWQHKGSGEKLLEIAEGITKDAGYSKMAIISGIGVREYYRKFGYELDGPYMTKTIR